MRGAIILTVLLLVALMIWWLLMRRQRSAQLTAATARQQELERDAQRELADQMDEQDLTWLAGQYEQAGQPAPAWIAASLAKLRGEAE